MFKRSVVVCAFCACPFMAAEAHHGLDFFNVETAHLPQKGAAYAVVRADRITEKETETAFAPNFLYGATDWLALELHAHYEKLPGESLRYEAVAPAMHVRLTPPNRQFSFGISAEHEIAHSSDAADATTVAAVLGYQMNTWTLAGNLLHENVSGEADEWGYAFGVRNTFGGRHGLGLELFGSLEGGGSSELMVGYYGELSPRFTLNAGIGTGVDQGPEQTARVGFIWQLK